MSKMFKKKTKSRESVGGNNSNMTPLTVPGVVERGQCVKCADGKNSNETVCLGAGGNTAVSAVPVPTVKAVPVVVSRSTSTTATENHGEGGNNPPPPQSKPEGVELNENGGSNTHGDLKQPPEKMAGVNNGNESSSSSGDSSSSSSGSEESESEDDVSLEDGVLEDVTLLDLDVCQIETDHASSSLVNSMRRSNSARFYMEEEFDDDDDRKPAATVNQQMEGMDERVRNMNIEAAAVDMACEASVASDIAQQQDPSKLRCPCGMSPEVFYELPPEMQKEVIEEMSRAKKANSGVSASKSNNDAGSSTRGSDATSTSAADIDPETLASLPDNIREEVLEQARREQQLQSSNSAAGTNAATTVQPRPKSKRKQLPSILSMSTTAFLYDCDIDAEDYANFPEEVKKDIMTEKVQRKSLDENISGLSGYDPETLASLPEDVRQEVLEEERRQREKKQQQEKKSTKKHSSVGAHHVTNVPAGYDPDTFSALPEEMQKELLDDAARQSAGRGGGH